MLILAALTSFAFVSVVQLVVAVLGAIHGLVETWISASAFDADGLLETTPETTLKSFQCKFEFRFISFYFIRIYSFTSTV